MIVGLTGGIGSGKTTVAEVFKKLDSVAVYIADIEARKIMNSSEVIRIQLLQAFGKETYKNNELKDEDRFYNLKWMEQAVLINK